MELNAQLIPGREKLILVGLYLSKYDSIGLKRLGFDSFSEAFNTLGYVLGSKPASIKNYRDEFDPLFPNRRKGCISAKLAGIALMFWISTRRWILTFSALVQSFVGYSENTWSEIETERRRSAPKSNFAERLITGLAAEQYFESVQPSLPEFTGYSLKNTTRLGCGYDFRLEKHLAERDFLAVEVKGLKGATGSVSLTRKEHEIAAALGDRFFLFVVKNFRDSPFHKMYRDPLSGDLRFEKQERVTVQVSCSLGCEAGGNGGGRPCLEQIES